MNLMFSLKILTDLCYFMFAISSITSLPQHSGILITSPLIAAIAAYFSRFLYAKFPKKPWLRFPPLLFCAACFLFTAYAADIVVTVPMVLYVVFTVFRRHFEIGYDEMLSRFYLCMKVIVFPLLITVIASNWSGFLEVMLPYFFFYLVLIVFLLRMLRHNEKVFTDRRFRLMNVGEMLLLCGVGYLLSSGYVITALKFLLNLIVRFVLRPILTGIVYIFGGLAWLLSKLFSGIEIDGQGLDLSTFENTEELQAQVQQAVEGEQSTLATQVFTYVLIGFGVLVVVLIIVLLFRALMKSGKHEEDNKFEDVREALDVIVDGKPRRLTRAPRDRVRHYYRKFLKLCYVRGIGADEYLNSREINDRVRHIFQTPSLAALRVLYIKARYSSADITTDDVKQAKGAYEEVRKSGE